jgi:ferredoxin-NADP reductase
MAGTALLGGLTWRLATVIERREETPTACTLVLNAPGWPGHDAGQHVDVRLTAPDGYTAVRSYSIANAVDGERLEITVELLPDGEVSPYLAHTVMQGNPLEVRGPIGGWFVWRPALVEPVQLVAGGSGIVPLMAMIRTRAKAQSRAPFQLLYSVRSPESIVYGVELQRRAALDAGLSVIYAYTRATPVGWPRRPKRVDAETIAEAVLTAEQRPWCYVCGPTAFVEVVADLLIKARHDPSRIKTERFGPSGGKT